MCFNKFPGDCFSSYSLVRPIDFYEHPQLEVSQPERGLAAICYNILTIMQIFDTLIPISINTSGNDKFIILINIANLTDVRELFMWLNAWDQGFFYLFELI